MAAVLLVVVVGARDVEDTKKSAFGILARSDDDAGVGARPRQLPIFAADLAHGFPPVRPIRKKLLVSTETDYTEARLKPSLLRPLGKVAI
jgi:hypothetical protein